MFCEIQHGRCEQRDLADFAAMTSSENPLLFNFEKLGLGLFWGFFSYLIWLM